MRVQPPCDLKFRESGKRDKAGKYELVGVRAGAPSFPVGKQGALAVDLHVVDDAPGVGGGVAEGYRASEPVSGHLVFDVLLSWHSTVDVKHRRELVQVDGQDLPQQQIMLERLMEAGAVRRRVILDVRMELEVALLVEFAWA